MANKRSTSKDKARARYLKRHNGSPYPDDIVDELKRSNRRHHTLSESRVQFQNMPRSWYDDGSGY